MEGSTSHQPICHQVILGRGRRLVLPRELCEKLDLDIGDLLAVTIEDDSIKLESAAQTLARFQAELRELVGDRSLADELIAERRAEAARE